MASVIETRPGRFRVQDVDSDGQPIWLSKEKDSRYKALEDAASRMIRNAEKAEVTA